MPNAGRNAAGAAVLLPPFSILHSSFRIRFMSRRTEMLGSTIQRELAEVIQREIQDPRLPMIVSITRVKVSNDLEFADVYVSVMGTPGQQTAALNALKHAAGLMRSRLTRALGIRVAPFL